LRRRRRRRRKKKIFLKEVVSFRFVSSVGGNFFLDPTQKINIFLLKD